MKTIWGSLVVALLAVGCDTHKPANAPVAAQPVQPKDMTEQQVPDVARKSMQANPPTPVRRVIVKLDRKRLAQEGVSVRDVNESLKKAIDDLEEETPQKVSDIVVMIDKKTYRIGDVATVEWADKSTDVQGNTGKESQPPAGGDGKPAPQP